MPQSLKSDPENGDMWRAPGGEGSIYYQSQEGSCVGSCYRVSDKASKRSREKSRQESEAEGATQTGSLVTRAISGT